MELEVVGVSKALEQHGRDVIRDFAAMLDDEIEHLEGLGLAPRRERGLFTLVMTGGSTQVLTDFLATPRAKRSSVDVLIEEMTRIWMVCLVGSD